MRDLPFNLEDKDIIVDILICETKDNINQWDKTSKNAGVNYMRSERIKSSYLGTNRIES